MRVLFSIALLLHLAASAQPEPPSFCFVLAEPGRPARPLQRTVHVVQHYRERWGYVNMDQTWLRPDTAIALEAAPPLKALGEQWVAYYPVEGRAESYVLIIAGADTMRVDLPEGPYALIEVAQRRWDRSTPDVLAFRKGHFKAEDLVRDTATACVAQALARTMIANEEAAYQQLLVEQAEQQRRSPPPPPPSAPPHVLTKEEIEREIAQRPGLKEVSIARTSADTVWVRISGRVMLTGGCASGMPLFGIELRTDTGWVERLPMQEEQMDCGMPWADWNDREVMLPPLRWWVGANQPAPLKELKPGTYRIVLEGANMVRMRTPPFDLN